MELYNFVKDQISSLTDMDSDDINENTLLSDLDLVSLDYISIEVALKKKYGLITHIAELSALKINTFGEFIHYLSSKAN